jgi:hypothetical protein
VDVDKKTIDVQQLVSTNTTTNAHQWMSTNKMTNAHQLNKYAQNHCALECVDK